VELTTHTATHHDPLTLVRGFMHAAACGGARQRSGGANDVRPCIRVRPEQEQHRPERISQHPVCCTPHWHPSLCSTRATHSVDIHQGCIRISQHLPTVAYRGGSFPWVGDQRCVIQQAHTCGYRRAHCLCCLTWRFTVATLPFQE